MTLIQLEFSYYLVVKKLTRFITELYPIMNSLGWLKFYLISWLYNKHSLLEVIDKPWSPLYETKQYITETEPLPDFEMHLCEGITELKIPLAKDNPAECSNLLHFINEISQLKETPIFDDNIISSPNNSDLPILATILSNPKKVEQVYDIHKHLTKSGRNPIGRGGNYHIFGLVKYSAYK